MKKLVLIAIGFAILALVSGIAASGSFLMGFSRISKYMQPDLIVRHVGYNRLDGFDDFPGLKVILCNRGKMAVTDNFHVSFEGAENYNYFVEENIGVNRCMNFVVSYYSLVGNDPAGYEGHIQVYADMDNFVKEVNENNNSADFNLNVPTCGNNVCEDGESQGQCPYDCEVKCSGPNCGNDVFVKCGCEDSADYIGEVGLITNKGTCESCSGFEELFNPYAKMQTGVYGCLSDYFDFEPPRVPYLLFNYPEPPKNCEDPDGCYEFAGDAAGFDEGIMIADYDVVGEGVNYPTSVAQLYPDVHETTHYFVGHMLHGLPNWFNEAVAFQTTERLSCGVDSMLVNEGVAYDAANEYTGIIEFYSQGYYDDVMAGIIDVSSSAHVNGALFAYGLEKEFGCTEDCFAEIVSGLRDYEEEMCENGECGIDPINGSKLWNIDNDVIYKVVSEVIGSEPDKLYEVLDLSY